MMIVVPLAAQIARREPVGAPAALVEFQSGDLGAGRVAAAMPWPGKLSPEERITKHSAVSGVDERHPPDRVIEAEEQRLSDEHAEPVVPESLDRSRPPVFGQAVDRESEMPEASGQHLVL